MTFRATWNLFRVLHSVLGSHCNRLAALAAIFAMAAVPPLTWAQDGERPRPRTVQPAVEETDADTRELRVWVAGQGSIEISTGDGIACPLVSECAAELPAGIAVTISAEPDPGYEFGGWRFCDNPADNLCTVTLDENLIVGADFVSTTPLTLRDEVVSFGASRLDQVDEFEPETGILRLRAGADVTDILPGTVIISSVHEDWRGFPSAFARTVRRIHRAPGAPTYLETDPATLDQIIAAGTLSVSKSFTAEDVRSYVLPEGVRPADYSAASPEFFSPVMLDDGMIEYQVANPPPVQSMPPEVSDAGRRSSLAVCPAVTFSDGQDGDTVAVEGLNIGGSLEICLEFFLQIEKPQGREDVRQAIAEFHITPRWTVEASASSSITIEKELPLKFLLGAIPTPIGPIVPEVGFKLIVTSEVGGLPAVEVEYARTAYLKLDYLADRRPRLYYDVGLTDSEIRNDWSSESTAEAKVDLYLQGDISMKLWKVIGPFVGAGPYLDFVLERPRGCSDFNRWIGAGLRGRVGLRLDLVLWGADLAAPIRSRDFYGYIFEDFRCDVPDDVPPPAPSDFQFTDRCTTNPSDSWIKCPEGVDHDTYVETRKVNVDGELTYDPGDQIVLSWKPPHRQKGRNLCHDVRFRTSDQSEWQSEGTDNCLFGKTYRLNNAEADKTYEFQVKTTARKDGQVLTSSDWAPDEPIQVRVEPYDNTPPNPPKIIESGSGSKWVYLAWEKPEDPGNRRPQPRLTFKVDVLRNPDTGWRREIETEERRWVYATELDFETEYCLYVAACDKQGARMNCSNALASSRCPSTLPDGQQEWRFRARCEGQDAYLMEDRFDLAPDEPSAVGFNKTGDYGGGEFLYNYRVERTEETETDGAPVTGYFEINVNDRTVRKDTFAAALSDDTGDIQTTPEIDNGGCNAYVRFDRPAAGAEIGSVVEGAAVDRKARPKRLFLP